MKWFYKEGDKGGFAVYRDDEDKTQITWGGCGCCSDPDDSIEAESDAKLASMAPELLEALIYARRFLKKDDHDTDYIDEVITRSKGV